MNDDMFQPKCASGHPIEIVSEGYGICRSSFPALPWSPWAFTQPASLRLWDLYFIKGHDGKDIPAWVGANTRTKEEALAYIQDDIDAHRSRPFDEVTERARLMPV